MSSLLTLPPEVLQHCIFPFLRWNDLLRLRRVCKASKLLVQNYVKANPYLAPEIAICGKKWVWDVQAFLDLGLVSTKIYINNVTSRSGFYQENAAELTRFLDLYGSVVTHLKLDCFSLYVSGMERTFLEGLINLQSIEAPWFDIAGESTVDLPQILKKIKILKLRCHGNGSKWGKDDNDGLNGFIELLNHCKMLETLSPLSNYKYPYTSLFTKLFGFLDAAIQQRKTKPENATLSKLKVIDFDNNRNFDMYRVITGNICRQFLNSCAKHGILMRGVITDGNECLQEFAKNTDNFKMPLQSFFTESEEPYNWIWLMETDMPFLERLILYTSTPEEIERVENRVVCRTANWPLLKNLDLDIDGLSDEEEDEGHSQMILKETGELCRFFFERTCYTNLSELSVAFRGNVGNDKLTAEQLTNSCPNLKKLQLNNWGGNNEQFVRLWEGLPNLEEVDLEHCSSLGDKGFLGSNAQKPVFFNLKKLRKLTLKSLCRMPGITDQLFIVVFRHLSLTHFTITSEGPIEKVTPKGIESLLGGRFEECIEKFSFKDWSLQLHSASPRQNIKFKKLFAHRLSNMM